MPCFKYEYKRRLASVVLAWQIEDYFTISVITDFMIFQQETIHHKHHGAPKGTQSLSIQFTPIYYLSKSLTYLPAMTFTLVAKYSKLINGLNDNLIYQWRP